MAIESLHIYPIKSCRGLSLRVAELDARGLVDDRRWMVIDQEGRFVTQREEPALARVDIGAAERGWALRADGETIAIHAAEAVTPCVARVWGDEVRARSHEEGSRFFSHFLDRPVTLVRFDPSAERKAGRSAPEASVAFADAYPLLVVSRASLEDLSRRVGAPIPMRRFRPNIVVGGAEPYAEDQWARVRLGSVEARMVKRCDRCTVVTVDDAGRRHREPLATLASYRKVGSKVLFGVNVAHEHTGTLRVGDAVVSIVEEAP